MFKHILIPTDGSPLSRAAAAAGVKLAASLGARVTALFAAPAPTPIVYRAMLPVGYAPQEERERLIERTSRAYLAWIEEAAQAEGVKCEGVAVTDEYPAHAILETARKRRCDLIFMASHGRRGIKGVLLGSETQKVLAESPIPVLVYRGGKRS